MQGTVIGPFAVRAAGVALLVALANPAFAQVTAAPVRSVYVDIIPVTSFADSYYPQQSPNLSESYQKESEHLISYFHKSLPSAIVSVASGMTTTRAGLQKLLYEKIAPRENSVNLIFLMTHGHVEEFTSEWASRELFLVASDTRHDDVRGTGIPASQLLDAIRHFSRTSSTFVFIDSCNSGAAGTLGASTESGFWNILSVNAMILASSEAYQQSFNANFTRALIDEWSDATAASKGCVDTESRIDDTLSQRIRTSVGEPAWGVLRQSIRVVVPYAGEFCLDSLSIHGALLLLRNATANEYRVILSSVDGSPERRRILKPKSVLAERMDRREYILRVEDLATGKEVRKQQPVNFQQNPVEPLSVEPVSVGLLEKINLLDEADLLKQSAAIARAAGAGDRIVSDLYVKAAGIQWSAGQKEQAAATLASVPSNSRMSAAQQFVVNRMMSDDKINAKTMVADAGLQGLDLLDLGNALAAVSQFDASAAVCEPLVSASTDERQRQSASCAFLALSAAGKPSQAAKLARQWDVLKTCDGCAIVAKAPGTATKTAYEPSIQDGAAIRLLMDKQEF